MTPLTDDIDPRFDVAFLEACKALGCAPLDLLGVMFSESQCRPAAHNPNGDASGLIQFMPATLRGLGWKGTAQDFRCLSASQQLPYVVAYFRPWAKAAGAFDSAGRIYQTVFLPGTLRTAKDPESVICAHGGTLGWAFDANAVFDHNGDGRITISELSDAVARNATGARWREMVGRLGLEAELPALEDCDGREHVDSILDVQRALNALGADPELAEDGIAGKATEAAVRAFQVRAKLHEDGRAGPSTRAALARALESGPVTLREVPDDDGDLDEIEHINRE